MDLTKELRAISNTTSKRLARKEKEKKATLSESQKEKNQKEADEILKELPGKLRQAAGSNRGVIKYEVMIMPKERIPFGMNFNSRKLSGVAKIVFAGCKKLGLDVRVEHSEYDDGTTGVPCAGIWVHW